MALRSSPEEDTDSAKADGVDTDSGAAAAAKGPIASHAGSMISALFLLIFAIAVIVPWTGADSARQNTYAEANALVEAAWMARGLPPVDAAATQTALRNYAQFVATQEWPTLKHGNLDPRGWTQLDQLRATVARLPLKGQDQQDARENVQAQLQVVYAARRQRAVDADTSLPTGVLILTVLTAILVLAFPALSGARPRRWSWGPYLLLAASLTTGVYLVFAINHTFSGPLGVDPTAFTTALQQLQHLP